MKKNKITLLLMLGLLINTVEAGRPRAGSVTSIDSVNSEGFEEIESPQEVAAQMTEVQKERADKVFLTKVKETMRRLTKEAQNYQKLCQTTALKKRDDNFRDTLVSHRETAAYLEEELGVQIPQLKSARNRSDMNLQLRKNKEIFEKYKGRERE